MKANDLWNSNTEQDWNKSLEKYWHFVHSRNCDLEKELNGLNPNVIRF